MKRKESFLEVLVWQALKLYPTRLLGQFLSDPDERVKYTAARLLQINGGDYAFHLATELINSRKSPERAVGVFILGQLDTPKFGFKEKSLPLIKSLLKSDPSITVKCEALAALGHLSDDSTLDIIISYRNHKSENVRAAVAGALISLRSQKKSRETINILKKDKSRKVRYWAQE